jgi:hypothetical protein
MWEASSRHWRSAGLADWLIPVESAAASNKQGTERFLLKATSKMNQY